MYCCISLRLSSAFLFFVPLLLLSSIIYSVALLQLSSTLLYTTTVTRQHFHTLHQFYSWAALPCWATVHSRSFCPFGGRQVVRAINGKLYFHTSQATINCDFVGSEVCYRRWTWSESFDAVIAGIFTFLFPKGRLPSDISWYYFFIKRSTNPLFLFLTKKHQRGPKSR